MLVESLALDGPTLLLYEDIHWADASLLDLLETFATRVRDVPVLFVALARPELLTDRPGMGRRPPGVHGAPARSAQPTARAGSSPSSSSPSPTFRASGRRRSPRRRRATRSSSRSCRPRSPRSRPRSQLPTSVRAIIAARLDSLPPDERSVLVDASVVGRVFWRGALAEIAQRDELSTLLGSLEARDLIRREAVSRIQGDQQFGFKHGLIHDVAYGTLPRAARRERHAAVARFLEATTDVGQSHEALAHHWREAGETERAVDHLVAAADQAGRGWAKERAVSALPRSARTRAATATSAGGRITMRQLAIAEAGVCHLHRRRACCSRPSSRRARRPTRRAGSRSV